MKLLKKIVALTAIAACVVTMSTPVVAKADDVAVCANPGCHDGMHVTGREIYLGSTSVVTSTHPFNDMVCEIITVYDVYGITCECGQMSYGTRQSYVRSFHTICTSW